MALIVHMHLDPSGSACASSSQGTAVPNTERLVNLDGQLAGRMELDCDSNRTVRIEYSTDEKATWHTLMQATPPLVDSASKTKINPIPEALRTVVWIRALLVGGTSAVCRIINFETLDGEGI